MSHRAADRSSGSGDVFYEEDKSDEHAEMDDWFGWTDWDDDGYWTEAWWYDNDWEDYGDGYNDHSWYEDDDEFYEAEEQPWSGDPAAEPGHQGEDSQRSSTNNDGEGIYSSGGGKGKGSGPFGSGCYICGSKWHLAADCPVRGRGKGEGKSNYKGKSKGKYRKGKSKGKGKGKYGSKTSSQKGSWSSGKSSSWRPRYFVHYDFDEEYEEPNQLRHARQGLHLGDSPPKEPPRALTSASKAQHFEIKELPGTKSEYFEDLLRLERASKAPVPATSEEATTTNEQATDTPPSASSKNLTFFFRKHEERESTIVHIMASRRIATSTTL